MIQREAYYFAIEHVFSIATVKVA